MVIWNSLEKPESLQEGKRYFQIQYGGDERFPLLALVTFLAYTACPAVVVVQMCENSRVRCGMRSCM